MAGRVAFVSLLRHLPLLQASLQLSPARSLIARKPLAPSWSKPANRSLTMAKRDNERNKQETTGPWYHISRRAILNMTGSVLLHSVCFYSNCTDTRKSRYMDEEWGFEVHDDRKLFEMLILEGAQAGLSWKTVLMKREAYRKAFHGFDISRVAEMSEAEQAKLLEEGSGIIRNRLKVKSAVSNAKAALKIQEEEGSLDKFLWSFIPGGKPLLNRRKEFVTETEEARQMSAELKKRGMNFVGPTIIYAFMQACGMVVDHPMGSPEWEAARIRLEGVPTAKQSNSLVVAQAARKASAIKKGKGGAVSSRKGSSVEVEGAGSRLLRKRGREEEQAPEGKETKAGKKGRKGGSV